MEEISIKIYQVNGGDVRRFPFNIPKDPKASHQGIFDALFDKVAQIVPVNGSALQLAWKDEENDLIVMNTDEEVKEALRHRKGDIFRLFIRLIDGSEMPKIETPVKQLEAVNVFIGDDLMGMEAPPATEPKPTVEQHRGIICDGCDKTEVQGVRYKCLVCPDYDLCDTCEGKRIHDEHPMIRIAKAADKTWLTAFMASQGMSHFGFIGRRGRCPFQRENHQEQSADPPQCEPQRQRQNEIPGSHFLRDVGQAVAAVLNGFGIDVDVDVEDQEGQRTKVAQPKKENQSQAGVEKTEEKKQETATSDQPMESVASPPPAAPAPAPENMETGVTAADNHQDWMILDGTDAQAPQETPQAAASAPASTDPRIATALDYMMSMGFTNEGGWLTQLLEAKNGDIAAVLDILHPSAKP